jgi:hypothetical protein
MAIEARAQARPQNDSGADDYASFCAALSEGARGRAFLAEYARRNRAADTEVLLAALTRLETQVRADRSAVERLRDELRMVLIAIRLARPDIDAAGPPAKAAKLASLLDMLERRIDTIVEARPENIKPLEAEPAAPPAAALAIVPPHEEPELPIPSPANDRVQPSLVTDKMPEVTFVEKAPLKVEAAKAPAPEIAAPVTEAPVIEPPVPQLAPKSIAPLPPVDPLAPIMAMSEAERIALFT